ncbi:MAG: Hpt domain-containing protein [Spirochaetaceae bacterium]|nr:MAG: Hpt domain-containing protein [Spirochaetaceae bacterium]
MPPLSEYNIEDFVAVYAGDTDIIQEIIDIFLEEAPERLKALQSAFETGSYDGVDRVAHSLANTSGTLKAEVTLDLSRAVENAVRSGNEGEVATLLPQLIESLTEVIAKVREYRDAL